MKCPVCNGESGWYESYGIEGVSSFTKCSYCENGQVTLFKSLWYHIWNNMPTWCYEIYEWLHEKTTKESEE